MITPPYQIRTNEEFDYCQRLETKLYVVDASNTLIGKGIITAFDDKFVKVGVKSFDRNSHGFITLVDESDDEDAIDL